MSLKLYCMTKDPSAPSLSSYCEKVEALLRATGFTDYTLQFTTSSSAPKGKLPYVEYKHDESKTDTIADSHLIVRYLIDNEIVQDPDSKLTAAQRADSRAWQAWTEELVYGIVVFERWNRPENFAATKAVLPISPWIRPFLAWYMRRSILSAFWSTGIARHSDEDRSRLAREYFEGLEARLEGKEYFHGNEPTVIDTVLYAFLANTVSMPGNPETTAYVLGSERLRKYTARLSRMWFPEYEALIAEVEGKNVD